MKRKILFIIESLHCGGAEKSLVSLLPLLSRTKYDIYLWIMCPGGIFEKLLPDNIYRIQYNVFRKKNIIDFLFYYFCRIFYSCIIRLNSLFGIKKHNAEVLWKCMRFCYQKQIDDFDVAIAYQQGIPTYLLKDHINAKKKICWINADIFSVGYDPTFNYYKYKDFDFLVPVSAILKDKLSNKWPDLSSKMRTIYDIINPAVVHQLSQKEVSEEFPSNIPILLTVGRLVKPKGYDLLLDAALILKKRNINFKWYIIGEGSERQFIESFILKNELQNHVFLLGLKDNPYPYMRLCDVYVQTSRYEGFGMTVAEAKILYKPIVSTNYSVIYNILRNKINGLIVDMSGEAIADGIQLLFGSSNLRKSFINNLQSEENLTYQTEVLKLEQILDED